MRQEPTRDDDDRVLLALQMQDDGSSYSEVGLVIGKTRAAVSGMFRRIREDLARSEN